MTHRLRTFLSLAAPVAALAIMGQGCLGGGEPAGGPDGGLFRTTDSENWTQLTTLNLGTQLGSIANVGMSALALDPQDPGSLYAGTVQNGLLYSLDGGESWSNPSGLSKGNIVAIAAHPKDKCVVYAARLNQIMKTENCHRDWEEVFFDARTDKRFNAIAVDWFNPDIVYAVTNDGDIVRSANGGAAWNVVHRADGIDLRNIVIDPFDSRVIYVSAYGRGILKSNDGGQNWEEIRDALTSVDSITRRTTMVATDPSNRNRVYHISDYGILRSDDAGANWTALTLPSPPNSVDILAFAVHPKDPKRLVYATERSVVFSGDAGLTWTSKRSPTSRPPDTLLYDLSESPRLYLAPGPTK